MPLNYKYYIICLLFVLISGPLTAAASEPRERIATAKIVVPDYIEGTTVVDAEQVIELVGSTANLILIDSRLSDDRLQGYIETSIGLPNTQTSCESLAELLDKKDSPTVFYCNGVKCARSSDSARIALQCGYTSLYWFRGGIEEWKQKEYPLVQ